MNNHYIVHLWQTLAIYQGCRHPEKYREEIERLQAELRKELRHHEGQKI